MEERKTTGTYQRISLAKQAMVAKYACQHGNNAAARHFSKEFGVPVKPSSVSTWKLKYVAEVKLQVQNGDTPAVCSLPSRKRGRPMLLGDKLDTDVKHYIRAVRDGGGVVNTRITAAAATAIVRKTDRNFLAENGGPITNTNGWAVSTL